MHRISFFMVVLTIGLVFGQSSLAVEPANQPKNAALVYWQAIALLPEWTDEQKQWLNKTPRDQFATVKLDDQSQSLVNSCQMSLDLLQRAGRIPNCDWGSLWEDGLTTVLPHLGKARLLAQLAVLRGRHRIEAGKSTDDFISAIQLAHHASADGILISQLVRNSIEQMVFDVLSQNLSRLKTAELRRLSNHLESMPPATELSEALLKEKTYLVLWLRRQLKDDSSGQQYERMVKLLGAEVENEQNIRKQAPNSKVFLRLLDDLEKSFDEAAELAKLPPDQLKKPWQKLAKRLEAENLIGYTLFPALDRARTADVKAVTRRAMLKAALHAALDQQSQFNEIEDPFGSGPFTLRNTENGFVLSSKLMIEGKTFEAAFR